MVFATYFEKVLRFGDHILVKANWFSKYSVNLFIWFWNAASKPF